MIKIAWESVSLQITLTLREIIVIALHAGVLGSVISTWTRVAAKKMEEGDYSHDIVARISGD